MAPYPQHVWYSCEEFFLIFAIFQQCVSPKPGNFGRQMIKKGNTCLLNIKSHMQSCCNKGNIMKITYYRGDSWSIGILCIISLLWGHIKYHVFVVFGKRHKSWYILQEKWLRRRWAAGWAQMAHSLLICHNPLNKNNTWFCHGPAKISANMGQVTWKLTEHTSPGSYESRQAFYVVKQ